MGVAWTRLVGSGPYRPLGPHTSTGNAIGMLHDDIPLYLLLIVPDATGPISWAVDQCNALKQIEQHVGQQPSEQCKEKKETKYKKRTKSKQFK